MKTYLTNARPAPRRDASQIGVTPRGFVTEVTLVCRVQTNRYWVTADGGFAGRAWRRDMRFADPLVHVLGRAVATGAQRITT